jgi:glycosyltransferase involved in cell wall biosynthesis
VQSFIAERKLNIRYYKKENGGKHTAHNLALELAEGEWLLCVDSDDLLASDAVSKLLAKIAQLNGESGIIAYKEALNGNRLSDAFPDGVSKTRMHRLATDYDCRGEFTLAFATDFAKKFPFPVFEGERFVTECVVYDRMDQQGEFALLPEVITVCEYQADGYSSNFANLMKRNPSGFCLYFLQRIDLQTSFLQRIIHAGKYWCFRWICKRRELKYRGKHKATVALATIPGVCFRIYYKLFRGI